MENYDFPRRRTSGISPSRLFKEAYSVCGSANLYLDLKGEGAFGEHVRIGQARNYRWSDSCISKPAKTLEELGIEGFKFHRALLNFNINGPSVYILPGA